MTDQGGNQAQCTATLHVLAGPQPIATYVDAAYGAAPAGTVVNWPAVGGTGPHYIGCDAFSTIQGGIDRVASGGTVNVAAGTYVEDVVVNKPLALLGPNANTCPNAGVRAPEAIVIPASSDPDPYSPTSEIVIYVYTSNVTISGFTVDGDNPAITSGILVGAADVDAAEGIVSYEGVGSITIANNIIKNTSYSGVDFYNYVNSTPTTDNHITCNRFENIGYIPYGFGIGVLLYDNFYADVSGNVMTGVGVGVQTGNFERPNPRTTQSITDSTR